MPKLLKDRQVDTTKKIDSALNNARIAERQKQEKRILEIVKEIAKALVDYTKHSKRFEVFKDKGFELKSHQKVRIEDLLQIFVDNLELVKQFLEYVIDEFGEKNPKELEAMTTINLHHRLLEYYLYSKQMNEKTYSYTDKP